MYKKALERKLSLIFFPYAFVLHSASFGAWLDYRLLQLSQIDQILLLAPEKYGLREKVTRKSGISVCCVMAIALRS